MAGFIDVSEEEAEELTPPFAFGEGDDRPEWMQWVAPGAVGNLVAKLQRAQRNQTGVNFSPQQLRDLIEIGAAEIIIRAELEEMKHAARKSTLAAREGRAHPRRTRQRKKK